MFPMTFILTAIVCRHRVQLRMEEQKCFILQRYQHVLLTIIWRRTYAVTNKGVSTHSSELLSYVPNIGLNVRITLTDIVNLENI